MLGVVGHVPHQQSDREPGESCARIGQTVSVLAASRMLDDQQASHKRLREDRWQKPVIEYRAKAERDRDCSAQVDQ